MMGWNMLEGGGSISELEVVGVRRKTMGSGGRLLCAKTRFRRVEWLSAYHRFQANLGINHWNTLMHVVGYIKNMLDLGLTYSWDADLTPLAYVDANYGGCPDMKRSTSGYIFTMAGGPQAVTGSAFHH